MTAEMFYTLKDKQDDLLLAPTNFAVLGAPYGSEIPETLTDDTGYLIEMPAGWFSFGEIQKAAGVNLAPSLSVTGPEGYGSPGRRRDLVESEGFNVEFTAQESRLKTLDAAMDIDTANPINGASGTDIRFRKRRTRKLPEYSLAFIALDGDPGQEIYPYFIFPRMTNTNRATLGLTETNIMEYAMTMEMKDDGKTDPFYFGLAGPGAAAFVAAAGLEDLAGGAEGASAQTVSLPAGGEVIDDEPTE